MVELRKKRTRVWVTAHDRKSQSLIYKHPDINIMNKHIVEKIFENKDSVDSITELAEKCNSSRVTITKYCNLLNIKIDFKVKSKSSPAVYKLIDILEGKYPQYPTSKLRKRLIKEGYKENKCEKCGIDAIWNNEPLILQIDHKNGNNRDHRLKNLILLCPNCHSQTKTFGSKNIKNKRKTPTIRVDDVSVKH